MVDAAAGVAQAGIAEAHQLFHLAAVQALQTALEIDLVFLGLVLVAHHLARAQFQAPHPIHDATQGGTGQHQIAVGPWGFQTHQLPNHIGGEGHAAPLVQGAQPHRLR